MSEPLEPMSTAEVNNLAQRVIRNEVILDRLSADAGIGSVGGERAEWLILPFMAREHIPPNMSVWVWEEHGKASEMAVNGRPVFMSLNFVPVENVEALLDELVRLEAALAPVKEGV